VFGANTGAVHCSMLAEDAIKSAISNYYSKNPQARKTDLSGTESTISEMRTEKPADAPRDTMTSS